MKYSKYIFMVQITLNNSKEVECDCVSDEEAKTLAKEIYGDKLLSIFRVDSIYREIPIFFKKF